MMMYEYDKLEIPEEYKKMSITQIQKEKEKLYESMKDQKKGEVWEKIGRSPVIFRSIEE